MSVLTIPVKLLKCTFWFSSLGICISYKLQLMLMWLVEPHTLIQLFVTPWTVACQTSLSITNSQSFAHSFIFLHIFKMLKYLFLNETILFLSF